MYLAGKPGDLAEGLKAAGVDAYLHAGGDLLTLLQAALGRSHDSVNRNRYAIRDVPSPDHVLAEQATMRRFLLAAGSLALLTTSLGTTEAATRKVSVPNRYDGAWSIEVITQDGPCDRAYRYGVRIAKGEASYPGGDFDIRGRVSGNGSVRATIMRRFRRCHRGRPAGSRRLRQRHMDEQRRDPLLRPLERREAGLIRPL